MPTFPTPPALPVDGIDLNFAGIAPVDPALVTLNPGNPFYVRSATGNPDAFLNDGGALLAKYTADTITVDRQIDENNPNSTLTFGAYSLGLDALVSNGSGQLVQATSAIPVTFHARLQTLNGQVDEYFTIQGGVAGSQTVLLTQAIDPTTQQATGPAIDSFVFNGSGTGPATVVLPTEWHAGLLSLSWSVNSTLGFLESQDIQVVPNHAPTAPNETFSTDPNTIGSFFLGQSVSNPGGAADPDGQPMQYSLVGNLPPGVAIDQTGHVTLTPMATDQGLLPGEARTVTIQYTTTDGAQTSPVGTVTLSVTGLPLGPTLIGSDNQPTIIGGPAGQWIIGGEGGETLIGAGGCDTMVGDGSYNQFVGGQGNDLMVGDGGMDTMIAGSGHDTMVGHGAYVFPRGTVVPFPTGDHAPWSIGTAGGNLDGRDHGNGYGFGEGEGEGKGHNKGDVFAFEVTVDSHGNLVMFGDSVVEAFVTKRDVIQISPFLVTSFDQLVSQHMIQQVGANVVISINESVIDGINSIHTITLTNIALSSLHASNFTFG